MSLKSSIQLGDIVALKDGRIYIYLKCPSISYSATNNILTRPNSYFGNGLDDFNEELYNDRVCAQVVEIRKPIMQPLIFLDHWSLDRSQYEEYINESRRIYPEDDIDINFINIELYV